MTDAGRCIDNDDLGDFIASLEDYQTAIPDPLVQHFLNKAGFQTDDPRVIRLVALAAQKFVADVAHEALTQRRIHRESQHKGSSSTEDDKVVLTKEDLKWALQEFGIRLARTEYFADNVSTTTTTTATASGTGGGGTAAGGGASGS
ncbi:probable transcription initiation factor TFIID, subunit TAF10 [Cyanidioschyzon merolae strain 10D]|jgi:transcription initiation factor TFIID subunit 10|uniref:Probable transcription initiation factor TFIID, subunit TAF10 n=1 Tax=Cyanidioschyzon merolae (strain NIES-3377 / 10D) TaxID=280699 RepID=M1V5E1_CYAM1|nr:probable transcription initiation factor TFIID, subunit TAF10 [Cyanidioschyzon merolae strain 10D]BAM80510.1 probable transcription initiation factor TFIID, subunit TAF10 [Cyanidioschyzon merolae strain 10D]|eukprot:XP_005536546.1 probable transcription initiation factor TFIID, subunit TAF10 [Cyanidioschyzon merolae strain 10D]